jgi:hypothetical protein
MRGRVAQGTAHLRNGSLMGSWLRCVCGNQIHTNLFSSANVYRLIRDDEWDALGDEPKWRDVSVLFVRNREVFSCPKCSRLIVFWDRDGEPTYYTQEPHGE